jgi:hypothetical protein
MSVIVPPLGVANPHGDVGGQGDLLLFVSRPPTFPVPQAAEASRSWRLARRSLQDGLIEHLQSYAVLDPLV